MRVALHHLVRFLPILAIAGILAACQPSWDSRVPVGQGNLTGPMQVQRPAMVTVYSGDTVYSIARRYSLSVRELIEFNKLQPPYSLVPGQALRLPGGGSDYVVQKGDTLSVLARRFKVDLITFAATNNKKSPFVLHVGERLTIPGGKGAVATTASHSPSGSGSGGIAVTPPSGFGEASRADSAAPQASSPPAYTANPGKSNMVAMVPPPPSRGGSTFLWPLKGEVLAEFGPLAGKGQHNDGLNIAAPKGTPVKAAENGVVAYVGNELKGFGNLLLVKHADNWMTAYAHNDQLRVKRGDQVRRGQVIATVGTSGSVTTPQLHFEIRRGTEAVNPNDYLQDSVAMAQNLTSPVRIAY